MQLAASYASVNPADPEEAGFRRKKLHQEIVQDLLEQIRQVRGEGEESLPWAGELPIEEEGKLACFCALLRQQSEAFGFFKMVCSGLLTHRVLSPVRAYAADFHLESGAHSIFEVVVAAENAQELEQMHAAFAEKRREICLGLASHQLMQPVFMPRNEEEIIRNIMSLSSQIKYVRDMPQVFITFDEQTVQHLYFTIVLVRVLKSDSLPVQEIFGKSDTFLEYIHDRTQHAGRLRRKYTKEATVFRIKILKEHYLRADHSIDLVRARQVVAEELSRILGDVRDYNGGILSKQNELFSALRQILNESVKYNDLLLENFFYSLTPVIMRSVLEPEVVRTLFLMLLESIEETRFQGKEYAVRFSVEERFVFGMIKTEDRSVKEKAVRALTQLQLHASKVAFSYVSVYDHIYLGIIYRCDDPQAQELFCETLRQGFLLS
jgi:hypothetical protein